MADRASSSLAGDAGIAKSRLAEELLTWRSRQGVITVRRSRAYAARGRLSVRASGRLIGLRSVQLASGRVSNRRSVAQRGRATYSWSS